MQIRVGNQDEIIDWNWSIHELMVYVLNHLDSSSIVDWFEVADQDEIFLESLRIILTILFDCSCWGFFPPASF